MFELLGQGPLYDIVDALDDCPNSSGVPAPREQILEVLEQFADLHLQHLHLCVTSRPEADIQAVFEPLTAHTVSIHDEGGQNRDITNQIKSVVLSDSKMRRWREENKRLAIDTLTQKAGGVYAFTSKICLSSSSRDTGSDGLHASWKRCVAASLKLSGVHWMTCPRPWVKPMNAHCKASIRRNGDMPIASFRASPYLSARFTLRSLRSFPAM